MKDLIKKSFLEESEVLLKSEMVTLTGAITYPTKLQIILQFLECVQLHVQTAAVQAVALVVQKQEQVNESPCKTCKDYESCRIPKQVCYRDIVRKYGTKHWDYPDVNCPKSL